MIRTLNIEPAELSVLTDCEVSLDVLNYLGKRMDGMDRLEKKQFLAALSCDDLNTAEQTIEDTSTETSETKENVENTKTDDNANIPEVSALTERDLRRRIGSACDAKMGDTSWCYIAFWFPEDKVVWCEYGGRKSQLDFMKFTYEVSGETVTVSDGEKVTLTVEPTKINDVVAEYEKTIAEKDDLIVKASSEITSLKSENTELSQYKEKFTQMEQEKVAAELAQKKEDLIQYHQELL